MIYYRLSLFILICLSYLSCPSLSRASSPPLMLREAERNREIVAQGTTTTPSSSLSSGANSSYDQVMQAGYKATQEKDYKTAQQQFQKALELRPNDLYAQQALQNVEFYLARQSNPLANLLASSLGLWIGLGIIVVGIGIGIWLYLRRVSPYSQDKLEEELLQPNQLDPLELDSGEDNNSNLEEISTTALDEHYQNKAEQKTPLFSSDSDPITSESSTDVVVETSNTETLLPIQKTTRISSSDPVEALVEQLQENDPKKRRQAIWKLAQKADSRAMEPLVDLMIDTDSQERSLILEALSQISARTLKPMNHALTLSLQDKNPQVRKNAIRDLTRIHELMSQIYQLLCHAIDDSDREVQETAKWAINQLNTQIPPRLDMMTGDETPEVTVEQSYSDTME